MSAVNEAIVREFFELHGFFVLQQRKYITPNVREDDDVDFFVLNPHHAPRPSLPFVLGADDLPGIARALVVVKGWHTETFSPSTLVSSPEIFRFLEPLSLQQAAKSFGGDGTLTKLLVVPTLPTGAEARAQSIELLKSKGIDAVLPFRTMLADLIDRVEVNRNYQKSDLLQVIRILKNYDFVREKQLELFKAKRKGKR